MKTIIRFFKNYKFSIPLAIIILIAIIFFATRGGGEVKAETIIAARKTISQEVSVTGRVVPAQSIDLSIQSGGKVTAVNAKVGQNVTAGQTLLRVDSADLQIRLERQQAALEKAKLAFNNQTSQDQAADELKTAYEDGFNTLADSFIDIPDIVTELDNILYDASYSPYLSDLNVRSMSQNALNNKQAIGDSFDRAKIIQRDLTKKYNTFNRNASPEELEAILNNTHTLLKDLSDIIKDLRNLIVYVEERSGDSPPSEIDRDQSTLTTYISDINTHLSAISSVQTDIKDAEKGITDQSNDTQSGLIDIKQAELDIQDTFVQMNNRTIKSPVNGIVTDIDVEVGETISAGNPVISVISRNQYEIDANIPEADVAKVNVGANTEVTLDAYGSDVVFKATVISINPSETLIDGVATYKTTLQFVEDDTRIKSGMTASLIIKGEQKENVITIPQRSVITKGTTKYVEVVEGEKIVEKIVETGLRGSDGSIEITSGIAEGDKVVVFNEQK